MLKERARPVSARALIIPIIMAHYENVINNTEDIVVAISHMVVGLCSVTNSPLASTYVCQKRASMTSVSSAHLALPEEKVAGEMSISWSFSSSEWIFHTASGRTGDKCHLQSGASHQSTVFSCRLECTPQFLQNIGSVLQWEAHAPTRWNLQDRNGNTPAFLEWQPRMKTKTVESRH